MRLSASELSIGHRSHLVGSRADRAHGGRRVHAAWAERRGEGHAVSLSLHFVLRRRLGTPVPASAINREHSCPRCDPADITKRMRSS
jgi:hypothetical protein